MKTKSTNKYNHGLEQNFPVFETASGKAIRSVNVNPVVMSGQNFSLSDGRRLAVLNDSGVRFRPAFHLGRRARQIHRAQSRCARLIHGLFENGR